MRRSRTRAMVGLNAVLLVVLTAVSLTPDAGAQSATRRPPGVYSLVGGELASGNANGVYVLDSANRELILLRWDNARNAVEESRERIAACLGARPAEIVFTSCATESINHAVRGVADVRRSGAVVTSAVEHSVTLDVVRRLEREGRRVVVLPVEADGTLSLETVRGALADEAALLSLIWVNNETGVFFDIEGIGAATREAGIPLHVDATQLVGKRRLDLSSCPVDLLSFSGHKFGAPKGVGGLWIRRGARVRPLMWGGHQETGRRSGTENVAGIVAMAAAMEYSLAAWDRAEAEVARLRDRLVAGLRAELDILENGADASRAANTASVCFDRIEGAAVVLTLSQRGVYCSSGSACTARDEGPSHVLQAMGVPGDRIHGAVRFSLSHDHTEDEIDFAVARIVEAVRHVSRVRA